MPRGALSNSHRKRSLELITGYKAVQAFKLVADKIKQNLLKHVLEQKMWAADVRSRHNKRIALLQDGARGVCARGARPGSTSCRARGPGVPILRFVIAIQRLLKKKKILLASYGLIFFCPQHS